MIETQVEVEAKLAAPLDLDVPELDGALPGLHLDWRPVVELDATYHDAADLRLARAGIQLRHRLGEGGVEGTWTLKLPRGKDHGEALRRVEHVAAGAAGSVPSSLATLARPWVRTAPLVPVVQLHTTRRPGAVSVDGVPVGEVVDDRVVITRNDAATDEFRELEVEIADDAVRHAVVARLLAAGAEPPAATPKLVRALGPVAEAPPDLAGPDVGAGSSAGDVLRAGMAAAVARIVTHDAVVRADEDPEGVHQARVGCRRLRSDLRTFAPILDRSWSEPLRDELRWFAGELGAVRDLDVLGARLRDGLATLPEQDREAAAPVLDRLAAERAGHLAAAIAVLDSDRYLTLLDRLVAAVRAPVLTPEARRPAAELLPPLAGRAFARLRKAVQRLGDDPTDEALHALRILAKRARYAADVAVPVIGQPARRYAEALASLQDVLGDHHDCAVAEGWLRTVAAGSPTPEGVFALGWLAAVERQEAARLRGEWRAVWERVDRRRRTRWIRG